MTELVTEIDFGDLAPREVAIKLNNKHYVLREASGDAAVKFRNANTRCAKLIDGKLARFGNLADSEPEVLSYCMYQADAEGKLRLDKRGDPDQRFLVHVSIIRSWPVRVLTKLFSTLKEISPGLVEPDTAEALEKRLKDTQEKLDGLRNGHAKDEADAEKNGLESTTAGLPSAES